MKPSGGRLASLGVTAPSGGAVSIQTRDREREAGPRPRPAEGMGPGEAGPRPLGDVTRGKGTGLFACTASAPLSWDSSDLLWGRVTLSFGIPSGWHPYPRCRS